MQPYTYYEVQELMFRILDIYKNLEKENESENSSYDCNNLRDIFKNKPELLLDALNAFFHNYNPHYNSIYHFKYEHHGV